MASTAEQRAERARLRNEAKRFRATNPFYQLSFYTLTDQSTERFIEPCDVPRGALEAKAIGHRMGVELLIATERALHADLPNLAGSVVRKVFTDCRHKWVKIGFGEVIERVFEDALDWTDAEGVLERARRRDIALWQRSVPKMSAILQRVAA